MTVDVVAVNGRSNLTKLTFLLVMAALITPSQSLRANALQSTGDILQFAIPAYAFGYTLFEKDFDGTKQFLYALGSAERIVFSSAA